jgi:hypothetical protein
MITFSMAFFMLLGEAQLLTLAADLVGRLRAQERSPA